MKIAFIDHSFHKKTMSNVDVVANVLTAHGHCVDFFWDEHWNSGKQIPLSKVLKYDAIINFQSYVEKDSINPYARLHDNIIYIPMFDQFQFSNVLKDPYRFDIRAFFYEWRGSKIIAFSNTLKYFSKSQGIATYYAKYYQAPNDAMQCPQSGLHGFLWLRHSDQVSWQTVQKLIGKTKFDSFHIHIAVDPHTSAPTLPSQKELETHNITTSTWFENKADYEHILSKANIFFAPRACEGIGQSFLEAFARGQCVIAPNEPTMNEYILHNFNGILYNHENPSSVDFSDALQIGNNGKIAAAAGYKVWVSQQAEMVKFITTPQKKLYSQEKYETVFNDHLSTKLNYNADSTKKEYLLKNRLSCEGVSWEAIAWAYRLLCGREPDFLELLQYSNSDNTWDMVRSFLRSDEFRAKLEKDNIFL